MRRAFLVFGPESSGNRFVAAILARAGCRGVGSSQQPPDSELLRSEAKGDCVLIGHGSHVSTRRRMNRLPGLARKAGYEPVVLVLARDQHCVRRSQIERGHTQTDEESDSRMRMAWLSIFGVIAQTEVRFRVVTYESLVQRPVEAVRKLMEWCGLRTDNLSESFSWEGVKVKAVTDENAKWYGEEPPCPR